MGLGQLAGSASTAKGPDSLMIINDINESISRLESVLRPIRVEFPVNPEKEQNDGELINNLRSIKARLHFIEQTIRI